jgi:hypothetical protein
MGIICGEIQHSDHTMSSFCEEKYNYAILCNLRADKKNTLNCSQIISWLQKDQAEKWNGYQ